MKALVVDDDPGTRRLLARVLARDHHCTIIEAADGREALSLVAATAFDFVMLDLLMPLVGGVEVLVALRRSPEHRTLPVMVLSAVRDERRVREAIQLGISDYLSKPLRPDATAQRVRRFVSTITASDRPDWSPGDHFPSGPGASIVLIDGDPGFRRFFTDVLHRRYTVATHATGAEGFAACRAAPPAAVFLGRHLGLLGEGRLVAKLRALPGLAGTRFIGVGLAEVVGAGVRVDATIARDYDVQPFAASVARALGAAGGVSLLDLHASIHRDLVTAVEQAFGMMIATDVERLSPPPPDPVDGREAHVMLDAANTPDALSLRLQASACDARQMAARLRSTPLEEVGEADIDAALAEIAAVVAGRIRQALIEEGPALTVHPPVAGPASPPGPTPGHGRAEIAFRSTTGALTCRVLLTARPLAP